MELAINNKMTIPVLETPCGCWTSELGDTSAAPALLLEAASVKLSVPAHVTGAAATKVKLLIGGVAPVTPRLRKQKPQ